MTTAIQTASPKSIIAKLAGLYTMEPAAFAATVKKTVFPSGDCTNEQLAAFLVVCDTYQLNPILKEIHAFPGKNGAVVPIVALDGWLTLANRHPQFNGMKHRPEFDNNGNCVGITCVIWRKDRQHSIEITEWLSECKRGTEPWRQMPLRMLRNRATCQAIRHAFALAGVMEADEAEAMVDMEAEVVSRGPAPKTLGDLSTSFQSKSAQSLTKQPEQEPSAANEILGAFEDPEQGGSAPAEDPDADLFAPPLTEKTQRKGGK